MRRIPTEIKRPGPKLATSWENHDAATRSLGGVQMLENLGVFITRIVEKGLWDAVWLKNNGRIVEFDSFEEYATTKTPDGLGTTIQHLKNACRDDPKALDAIDKATQRGRGNQAGVNQYTKPEESGIVSNIHNSTSLGDQLNKSNSASLPSGHAGPSSAGTERPAGTTRDAALRRLRKDREDLHARVLAGDMSAHAAMVQAGFRKVKTPKEQALHWLGKCSQQEIDEILSRFSVEV